MAWIEPFPVPASVVEPWQEFGLTVDEAALLATLHFTDEDRTSWVIVLSLRGRVVLSAEVTWGRHTDTEREFWVPLVDGSRGWPAEPDVSSDRRLEAVWSLACGCAAHLVLDERNDDGRSGSSDAQDRLAWARSVVSGAPPDVPRPWEVPEVDAFVRSWIALRTRQLQGAGLSQYAPQLPSGWPADEATDGLRGEFPTSAVDG